MRKRQWKKILSVVLALAMVFSMNFSAYAEPVSENASAEDSAIEEPAETEEPAAADETAYEDPV